jgi:23S rRNA (adenine2030-N6)-methyltransferase
MLSYLHGFHAGNHADALKHVVLLALLEQLIVKEKPLRYIDTHAGAGGYRLRSSAALKNREYESGIAKLWAAPQPPLPVARLIERVRSYNPDRTLLTRYPGSPWLARECLRATDRLYFFELHPAEQRALAESCADDRRSTVLHDDGLAGCVGLVPPPERRGLVFIDPAYEVKDEHRQVVDTLIKAHRRFATGVYAIWYPVIERRWVDRFERALERTGIGPMELYELSVAPDAPGHGLTGSGVVVVNPPWKPGDEMRQALPWLARILARERDGSFRINALTAR